VRHKVPVHPSPLVSIVTPAYNEEEHIAECIESVLAQTYGNWDYTIVDNCSTDATRIIAEDYAAKDPRIHVVANQSFVSAVADFNIGLRQISPESKYCKIVLADDWMFPGCLKEMVALMEEHPSVGIVGAYGLMDQWILWAGLPYPSHVVAGHEICRQRLLGGPYVFGSQTSVLFRADAVRSHDPFYNEGSDHPDVEACLELLKTCDFGFVHQVLTFSRARRVSLLSKARELNTLAASMVREVIAYGPHYLTPGEYKDRLREAISQYYEFLAKSFVQKRDKAFWEYHKRRLLEAGLVFSRLQLARGLCRVIGRRLRGWVRVSRERRYWGLG
jgi:glycosyltransferase involved in cell wall biosynthesis